MTVERERVLRVVAADAVPAVREFLDSEFARDLLRAGSMPRTTSLESQPEQLILEHERIPFVSYPYEWPAEMLSAAGTLTLDIATNGLKAGWGLKDATPFNVLFRGSRPVFVDVLSFERRAPNDSMWTPYAQFVRTFLLPLIMERDYGVPAHRAFMGQREGPTPTDLYRLATPLRRLLPSYLRLASLPVWLSGNKAKPAAAAAAPRRTAKSPEQARYVLRALLRSLRRALRRAAPAPGQVSVWSDYASDLPGYSDAGFAAKEEFVNEVLRDRQPARVLDIGANTGHFSALAARAGASVVAIDSDPVSVGAIWRSADAAGLDILPLVIDISDPSGPAGWRNVERASFLARTHQHFDLVLMLGVIHHLLVTDRIPLDQVVELMAELTTSRVIVEFISPQDVMFRHIARGRDALHSSLNAEVFEAACRARFSIESSRPIVGGTRTMYLLRKMAS